MKTQFRGLTNQYLTEGEGCPDFNAMQPFDADKYLGRWHMFRQSAGQDFLKNRDCVVAEYSWLDEAKTRIKAVNSSQ